MLSAEKNPIDNVEITPRSDLGEHRNDNVTTHTRAQTCMHTHSRVKCSLAHKFMRTHTHTHTQMHKHACTHTHMSNSHMQTRTRAHTEMRAHTLTIKMRTCMIADTRRQTCMHNYHMRKADIHTRERTHTNTHT